ADDTSPLEAVVEKQAQELMALKAQHTQEISALRSQLQTAESKLAQEGVVGGSYLGETGGASNRLCLSGDPQFDDAAVFNGADDTSPLEAVVEKQAQELLALKTQLQAAESKLAQEGVVGGSYQGETGGASNRLCLSRDPQFDDAAVFNGADDTSPLEAVVEKQAQELLALKTQLQAAESKLAQEGVVGGSYQGETGGASNRLCLSRDPQFDDAAFYKGYTNIHGAEYYIPGHDHPDVPCAVCRAPHPTTLMIPGNQDLPPGLDAPVLGTHHGSPLFVRFKFRVPVSGWKP
ncbi:hypothetical protein BaRGS_00003756, partial [Batillaria attramentaria]